VLVSSTGCGEAEQPDPEPQDLPSTDRYLGFESAFERPTASPATEAQTTHVVDAPASDAITSIPVAFETIEGGSGGEVFNNGPTSSALPGSRPPRGSLAVGDPEAAARQYLSENHDELGLSPGQADQAALERVHDTGRGAIVVRFGQRVGSIPVDGARLSVVLNRELAVVGTTGSLNPYAMDGLVDLDFPLSAEEALAEAAAAMHPEWSGTFDIEDTGRRIAGYRYLQLTWRGVAQTQFASAEPTRVRKVLFGVSNGLIPAYYLELITSHRGSQSSQGRGFVISAVDGGVLSEENLVDEVSTFRVWADPDSFLPKDSPYGTAAVPHPTNEADWDDAVLVEQSVVTVSEDALFGVADPWLPDNATETVGNNADSYIDFSGDDGLDDLDFRATTTGPQAFEHVHDTGLQPYLNDAQIMSELVMQFYVINYLHDLFYIHGFDEAAGNAQMNNFGRGGFEGDPVHVEAQDATGYYNANMLTPADGASPRMQLFLYPRHEQSVVIDGISYPTGVGIFSRSQAVSGIGRPVIDRFGDVDDGCSHISEDLTGVIAILDEMECDHSRAASNTEEAGALGLLLLPTTDTGDSVSSFGCDSRSLCPMTRQIGLNIPVMRVSFDTAELLRSATDFPDVDFDVAFEYPNISHTSSVDNLTVSHEWGHYLFRRLVGSVRTIQTGGMNEGFADVMSLLVTIEEADLDIVGNETLGGRYPIGHWIKDPPEAHYYGVRRAPYSTDFAVNPFTFVHIRNGAAEPEDVDLAFYRAHKNAETHATGEILAVTMLTVYRNLILEHGFDEARSRMLDYVVAGLSAAPPNPTFVEMRDAFLLVAYAAHPADGLLLWNAFAERGLGTGAVAPPRYSRTNSPLTEDFSLDSLRLEVVSSAASVESDCDGDVYWDGREDGLISVTVSNSGPVESTGISLTIATDSPSLEFPDGDSIDLEPIQPFESTNLSFAVRLDETIDDDLLEVELELRNVDSDRPFYSVPIEFRVNIDELPETSGLDKFEVSSVWSSQYDAGTGADSHWQVEADSPSEHHWFAANELVKTDQYLVSPPLEVDPEGGFTLSFSHRHSFDWYYNGVGIAYLDGGVVEISDDGGETWEDAGASSGLYYQRLADVEAQFGMPAGFNNPLSSHRALTGDNRSWPDWDDATIRFDDDYDGKTVVVRFRLASDMVPGTAYGWAIDEIEFSGISNTPFPSWRLDDGLCFGDPPIAEAGDDQIVNEGDTVEVSGVGSREAAGLPLSYRWSHLSGPSVEFESDTAEVARFVAPQVAEELQITLQLVVSADGKSSPPDLVVITVRQVNQVPIADAGDSFSVDEGDPVVLDSSGSSDGDDDELTYDWRQSAGPEVVLDDSESATPAFTAPQVDDNVILSFSLIVSDGQASSEADSVEVTVRQVNKPPVADAGSDSVVGGGAVATLNARDSFDPDGDELTYLWTQTDGTVAELGDATSQRVIFSAPDVEVDEDLSFQVVVSDGQADSPPASVVVRVIARTPAPNRPPRAHAGEDQRVFAGRLVVLDGSRSTDVNGDELTFLWTQTDGPITQLNDNSLERPHFEAHDTGTTDSFTFSLVVSDGEFDSTPHEVTVLVDSNYQPTRTLLDPSLEVDHVFEESQTTIPRSETSPPDRHEYGSTHTTHSSPSVSYSPPEEPSETEPEIQTSDADGCNTTRRHGGNWISVAFAVLWVASFGRRRRRSNTDHSPSPAG